MPRIKLRQSIQEAKTSGPQSISVGGKETAVVLSAEGYHKLTQTHGALANFFQESPWATVELDLSRSKEAGRDVDL